MVNKSILDYMPKRRTTNKRTHEQVDDDDTSTQTQIQQDPSNKSDESTDELPSKRVKTDAPDDGVQTPTAGTSTTTSAIAPVPATTENTEEEQPITFENFESLLDPSWRSAIGSEFKKPYFLSLKKFLIEEVKQGRTIFPPVKDVFNAFRLCKYDTVKVVLIGQDPYIQKGQAHGLCFSVISENVARPPSLKNIFTEMKSDISGFNPPKHSNLTKWAEQGVLLLNAVLTVREGDSNSHAKKGWETFTDAVIEHLNRNKKGLIFLLWGKPAQDKGKQIDTKKHHVLKAAHPSPLSASKGFFGCKHFSKCNEFLPVDQQINWKKICE